MTTAESTAVNTGYDIATVVNSKKSEDIAKPFCTICHDSSSGFHYGTHACEGCKGFFRRMVTNIILAQSMLQCTGTNKNHCDIDTVTRNNCQRCRLQKCFQMGMTRHKSRLGRRTKASVSKMEGNANKDNSMIIFSDEEMMRYIKRESRYFNNNDTEDDEPSANCIKHKAKLYSERNSKCYQKYFKKSLNDHGAFLDRKENPTFSKQSMEWKSSKKMFSDSGTSPERLSKSFSVKRPDLTNFGHDKNLFGMSDFDIGESRAMDFTRSFLSSLSPVSNTTIPSSSTSDGYGGDNSLCMKPKMVPSLSNATNYNKRTPMFESIRINTEKLQIDKMCVKIRIFLAYDLDNNDFMLLGNYKKVMSALNRHYFNPNMEEVDKFCRNRLDDIKYSNDPQFAFAEIKDEMIEMCKNIMDFFRRLPDLDLFQRFTPENAGIKKKVIQTLAIWMIKFVNVAENTLYNPKLSMKIPFPLLTQSPLRHFFETLFNLADIANSILTSEIDDTELSFISALIITFPKKGFIHCSENMLQTDNFLKVRFLYSALLYNYMLTEKFHQNIDNTENQFQKFCWLINQSHLLQERDVNYLFSSLKL